MPRPNVKKKRSYCIVYKVFGSPYQDTTSINLEGVPSSEIYNEVDRVLRERFGKEFVRVNHAGRTVTLNTGW